MNRDAVVIGVVGSLAVGLLVVSGLLVWRGLRWFIENDLGFVWLPVGGFVVWLGLAGLSFVWGYTR